MATPIPNHDDMYSIRRMVEEAHGAVIRQRDITARVVQSFSTGDAIAAARAQLDHAGDLVDRAEQQIRELSKEATAWKNRWQQEHETRCNAQWEAGRLRKILWFLWITTSVLFVAVLGTWVR